MTTDNFYMLLQSKKISITQYTIDRKLNETIPSLYTQKNITLISLTSTFTKNDFFTIVLKNTKFISLKIKPSTTLSPAVCSKQTKFYRHIIHYETITTYN